MSKNLSAGLAYFALVFALGFGLGILRTLLLPDASGGDRLIAVAIELPILIAASWFVCAHLIRRAAVDRTLGARALMGGAAFVLLMLAEFALGAVFAGRSVGEHLALYREPSYALGLVAQIGFGLMPLLQLRGRCSAQ